MHTLSVSQRIIWQPVTHCVIPPPAHVTTTTNEMSPQCMAGQIYDWKSLTKTDQKGRCFNSCVYSCHHQWHNTKQSCSGHNQSGSYTPLHVSNYNYKLPAGPSIHISLTVHTAFTLLPCLLCVCVCVCAAVSPAKSPVGGDIAVRKVNWRFFVSWHTAENGNTFWNWRTAFRTAIFPALMVLTVTINYNHDTVQYR